MEFSDVYWVLRRNHSSCKNQYLHTLLRGEALHEFETLSAHIDHTTNKILNKIIFGQGTYFFPISALSKKNHALRHGMRNPIKLKIRRYAAHLIELNEYLNIFPGSNMNNKIGGTELNEILLHNVSHGWGDQDFRWGFDFKYVPLKKATNMF